MAWRARLGHGFLTTISTTTGEVVVAVYPKVIVVTHPAKLSETNRRSESQDPSHRPSTRSSSEVAPHSDHQFWKQNAHIAE